MKGELSGNCGLDMVIKLTSLAIDDVFLIGLLVVRIAFDGIFGR